MVLLPGATGDVPPRRKRALPSPPEEGRCSITITVAITTTIQISTMSSDSVQISLAYVRRCFHVSEHDASVAKADLI